MITRRLAIIGGGPLCTYAVERLAAMLPRFNPSIEWSISIFDRTGRFGAGATHSDTQARTSYMNRVASQIAFAADESNTEAAELLPRSLRPTFYEWAIAKYRETGDERFNMRPNEIPRRYLHGQALREMFDRYVELLRRSGKATVDIHVAEVTDITRDETGFIVHAGAATMRADHILLVTGHSQNHPAPGSLAAKLSKAGGYVPNAYPLERHITEESVPAGSSVAVLGLGLTAIDVLLHLTEGRGGRFEADGRYVRSGREPRVIVGISPSGMFTSCRPENEKAADGSAVTHAALEHQGVFLTIAAIHALRGTESRQLDFERHVFPLVILEMAYVYFITLLGKSYAHEFRAAADARYQNFLRADHGSRDEAIEYLLGPIHAITTMPFDWQSLFEPLGRDGAQWQERLVGFMRRDHIAAAEGNLRNPVKAACDGVWRDLRSVFSEAADFGGLTAQSQRTFMDVYLRYYARMSNGIGLEAMRKVLALIEAGLVDVSIGPSPVVEPRTGEGFVVSGPVTGVSREIEIIVEGRAHPFDVERDTGALYPNLFRRGMVRRWRNPAADGSKGLEPGGLDVTRDHHPVQRDGSVERHITILGAPVEGVAFFQLSAARPRSNSAVLNGVARWANELLEMTRASASERVLVHE